MYIVNPLVIMTLIYSCQTAYQIDFFSITYEATGIYCLVFITAVVAVVLIFHPLEHLIDYVLKGGSDSRHQTLNKTSSEHQKLIWLGVETFYEIRM